MNLPLAPARDLGILSRSSRRSRFRAARRPRAITTPEEGAIAS
jgi:hypothetical protein